MNVNRCDTMMRAVLHNCMAMLFMVHRVVVIVARCLGKKCAGVKIN